MAKLFAPILKALRPHQWVKNILIFVPAILAHRITEPELLKFNLLGFIFFCAVASAGYIFNDIQDLAHDQKHAWKSKRPLAAGTLSVSTARYVACLLLFSSIVGSAVVNLQFAFLLLFYFIATSAYSYFIKTVAALDVITLALLYTVRVLAGGVLTAVPVSPWLLMFSMFFFFSLACVKRFAELHATEAAGRGYVPEDLNLISQAGISSGYLSVLVLALYVNSHEVVALYNRPLVLWAVAPVFMYWITRIWLVVQRGKLDQDPVVFALSDRVSYLCALCLASLLYLARS